MRAIKILFWFVLIIIAAVFGANNDHYVKVDLFPLPVLFYTKAFVIPLASCIFGIILGGIYASAKAIYWKAKYKRQLKKNEQNQS